MHRGAHGGRFRYRVADPGDGLLEAEWHGHVDVDGLRACCQELEHRVQRFEQYVLLIDALGVTGYDPDAHAFARRWARSDVAARVGAVAVVSGSQLMALESPAVALAPPRLVRLFANRAAARGFLARNSVPPALPEARAPLALGTGGGR